MTDILLLAVLQSLADGDAGTARDIADMAGDPNAVDALLGDDVSESAIGPSGPPPFEGAVFDRGKHRWVKGGQGDGEKDNKKAYFNSARRVIAKEFPEAGDMSDDKLALEFDISEWKDDIASDMEVNSDKFLAWFGDWTGDGNSASRVVDDTGNPKLVFHSSNADIDQFRVQSKQRANDALSKVGTWFVSDEKTSHQYGKKTYSVYLDIKNPLYLGVSDILEWDEQHGGVKPAMGAGALSAMIADGGHDGVILRPSTPEEDDSLGLDGEWDHEQYVVLKPEQVKIMSKAQR